jgi:hypothetical protein
MVFGVLIKFACILTHRHGNFWPIRDTRAVAKGTFFFEKGDIRSA